MSLLNSFGKTNSDEIRERGTVNAFNSFKGWGFIRREKGKDVYFYYSDIDNEGLDLLIGDVVEFFVKEEAKGPRAYSISRIASKS
ncbi:MULTISPECIES: retron Se72 family effector protein [Stutzerimonas stutzeri subgroup]|uniref:Cold shock domain family protein n=1 Tax=Stutzerimonas stutzeri CCUG 29243 TaxID=1196835 RepID=I4CZ05_STUST|nr:MULTISPECIES: retron Se72 family effector protein [Stutzerimonas stutzeri subgroup]AFM35312.1 cold shock domain family protein [Stutzerimonas stutzeri CCUG 29243]MCQ2038335.1 retron Se72 family effector protein [Stutzerimonas kunmingensis]